MGSPGARVRNALQHVHTHAARCSGDSWRARVSHICELQVNLAMGALTIDFGGLDRWDYVERARNLEEAVRPAS